MKLLRWMRRWFYAAIAQDSNDMRRYYLRGPGRDYREDRIVSMTMQNRRGEWVPAIPEPLWIGFLLRHAQCSCGCKFDDDVTYRGHYALEHIVLGNQPLVGGESTND